MVLEPGALAGHVLSPRCGLLDRLGLALIAAVAPHFALLAMQQLRQHVAVRHAGRAGRHRVDVALLRIHADVRLQPEVPLLALARLVHLRIALTARVLSRRRRVEDGRIHDRAGLDLDALGFQMHVHRLQHQTAKLVLLQQMPEAQHRRLVRCRSHAKVHSNEPAYRRRLIQQLFHAGVRQAKPLLHEVGPEHDRQTDWLTTLASLRIVRSHQRLKPRPRNHLLHLIQKQLASRLPTVLLKHRLTRQTLLLHRNHLAAIRLINHSKVAELVQRFPNVGQTARNYRRLYPQANIWSFEPAPDSFRELEHCLPNKFTAMRLALSDRQGEAQLNIGDESYTNSLLVRGNHAGKTIDVATDTIDNICSSYDISEIDILKIDVEGAATRVLNGAAQMLSRRAVKAVFIEVYFTPAYR